MAKSKDKQSKEIKEIENEGIADLAKEQFDNVLQAYGDSNLLQLRLEQYAGGEKILKETMEAAMLAYKDVLTTDAEAIVENPDQYIKRKALQINAGKKLMQFMGGRDTKDAITVPEVKPLMGKAEKG